MPTIRCGVREARCGERADIIRVFDALNDLRNMEAADQVKKEGAHLRCPSPYALPVHSRMPSQSLPDMKSMGADSICIKDRQVWSAP